MSVPLDEDIRQSLLALARRSIDHRLRLGRTLVKGEDYAETAPEKRGGFVTLSDARGDLRGCIGHILPMLPLDETVVRMAEAAALEDPRFPPVTLPELDNLRIEISALTVPEVVEDPEKIEVGRHGLIMSRGPFKGLLLPQVAPEWGWDRVEFLENTCRKAGLPRDGWKDPETRIEWFEAEVWGED
jgi:AmmeMemoRadiSam system protein A